MLIKEKEELGAGRLVKVGRLTSNQTGTRTRGRKLVFLILLKLFAF
jgi:hypothetical protein